jgi:large subunit ribosomal protein L21
MYAVVKTGGKQVRVQEGDILDLELLPGTAGEIVELPEVLLVGGDPVRIGTPLVEGAKVVARIEGATMGPKLRIFKHKRRKRYRLRQGHRQHYTRVVIESIEVS